jgi:hypothetical protein
MDHQLREISSSRCIRHVFASCMSLPAGIIAHTGRMIQRLSMGHHRDNTKLPMLTRALDLILLPGTFAVCKLPADAPIPSWATSGTLFSITRTADELSVVCEESLAPQGVTCERQWKCFRVAGSMPFSLVGVLASLVQPLAEAGISVFAVSTFDTDYVLVKAADLERTQRALEQAGHSFTHMS